MRVKNIRIGNREYARFRDLQVKPRPDWHAVFSVNRREEVWPFVCWGHTPESLRQYISYQECPLLHEVAGLLLESFSEEGGRFFINEHGAFCIRGEDENVTIKPEQFASWKPDEALVDKKDNPERAMSERELFAKLEQERRTKQAVKRVRGPL